MLLATLAKPSVVAWPLAAFSIDRWIVGSAWRAVTIRFAVAMLATLPAVVIGKLAQPAAAVGAPRILDSAWVALDAIGFYIAHWLVPAGYAIDYGRTPAWVLTFPAASVAFALVAIIAAGLIAWRRGSRLAVAGVFLAGVLPVLGRVPFDFQGLSTVADRYAYSAMLAPAIAVALAVRHFGRRVVRPALIAGFVFALSMAYHATSWSSDAALFGQAIAINPTSAAANATLAYIDVQRADASGDVGLRARLYANALQRYRIAITTRPGDSKIRYSLANLHLRVGAFEDAAREYATLADRGAADPRVFINWGIAFAQVGRANEASERFGRALAIDPTSANAHANWGLTLEKAGDRDGAIRQYRDALELRSGHPLAKVGLRRLTGE